MNDYTLTEIAVAFFAVLGLFGFGVWTFARAWLAIDRRRYRLPKPPPVPPQETIDARHLVEAWDADYYGTNG